MSVPGSVCIRVLVQFINSSHSQLCLLESEYKWLSLAPTVDAFRDPRQPANDSFTNGVRESGPDAWNEMREGAR